MKTKHRTSAAAKRARRWQADPGAVMRLIARTEPFTPAEVLELALPVRMAFEALRTERAETGDFDTLAAALNITLIRSESIDPLCEQTCIDAQAALMRARERHARTGVWGLDGPALQAIPTALDLHDQMLALSTPKQMQDAMREVLRRVNARQVLGASNVHG